MARRASRYPTDGELEILQVLWQLGPSTLGQIHAQLKARRSVATTTVATMLKVMMEKELVERSRQSGRYVWASKVTHRKAATGLLAKLLDGVFDGSAKRLVAHLVAEGDLSDGERQEIRELLGGTDATDLPDNSSTDTERDAAEPGATTDREGDPP